MKPRDLFSKGLTLPDHETRDLHYIGEALPAPSNPAAVLSLGTPASPGGSSVPAREDHVHGLDLDDLIAAIEADPDISIPTDLSGYYTAAEVDALLAGITVDLSDYYTIAEVDALITILAGDIITVADSVTDLSDAVFAALALYYTKVEMDAQPREIVWSYNSIVKPPSTYAGQRWPAPYDLEITNLIVTLQSASASDYTIKLYVAGSLVRTTVLSASSLSTNDAFSQAVTAGDVLYITIDTALTGTGSNLAAIVRFEKT